MTITTRDDAIQEGSRHYFTGVPCNRGHLSKRLVSSRTCLECARINSIKRRKHITDEQRKRRNVIAKKSYIKNAESIRALALKKYHENKEEITEKRKNRTHSQIEKGRKSRREWMRKWNNEEKMQSFCRKALRRMNGKRFTGKTTHYEKIVGYTRELFIQRIEFQFKDGMSWENHGKWHIDHKKPMARFIKQGVKDPKIINALSNLQPLWATDNIKKGVKFKRKAI